MRLLMTMTNLETADKMDKKLEEAGMTVHEKAGGAASLSHIRRAPLEFEIVINMAAGNFIFDRMIRGQLKSTLKQIDPGADIRKIS